MGSKTTARTTLPAQTADQRAVTAAQLELARVQLDAIKGTQAFQRDIAPVLLKGVGIRGPQRNPRFGQLTARIAELQPAGAQQKQSRSAADIIGLTDESFLAQFPSGGIELGRVRVQAELGKRRRGHLPGLSDSDLRELIKAVGGIGLGGNFGGIGLEEDFSGA